MKLIIILFICILCSHICTGHPVIWKHGKVVSSKLTNTTNEIKIHYSTSYRRSFGLHAIEFNSDTSIMFQHNLLLKRWNNSNYQGNIYVFSGLGSEINKTLSPSGHLGIQADWETRHVYTQLSMNSYYKDLTEHMLNVRLGFSPYLSRYKGLHVWMILEIKSHLTKDKFNSSILPVIRAFKDNILIEIGSNFDKSYLITAMIHF